ncbi:MAG: phage major capsid protein [Candidatus Dormibacteria bacterium]
MDRPEELRSQLNTLRDEIRALSETEALSDEQATRFDAALVEYTALEQRTVAAETRATQVAAALAGGGAASEPGADEAPGQINRRDPLQGEVRNVPAGELRDRGLAVLEQRGGQLSDRQKTHLEGLLRGRAGGGEGGSVIAQRLLVTETDAYHSAFQKGLRGEHWFTPEEGRALQEFKRVDALNDVAYRETRAANEGTGSAGGYGIPVLIDPTIVLTSGAADAPLLGISRIDTITTNQWKGVSSPGFSWAFQAEAAVVADNSPTLAQPTIPVYAARGFIPYSLEVEQDYPGFEAEMSRLLAEGYLNLVAVKTMQGSGTNEPTGIFTGMQTGSGAPAHIIVTTLGTLGAVDVRKAWGALPERFRGKATYVMSIQAENNIRAWGNALALSDYTVNMIADGTSVLTGRPVVLSDYAAPWTGTTGAASALVVGDFSHFRIIQRAGMSVELVQHLFDPSTGRPTGQRGWFGFARMGHDADTYAAFRLISNT